MHPTPTAPEPSPTPPPFPNPQTAWQDYVCELICSWWDAQSERILAQRERLAEVALAAPEDTELQAEITEELERMLGQYHIYMVPFMVGLW
jgi:hypothetical protein